MFGSAAGRGLVEIIEPYDRAFFKALCKNDCLFENFPLLVYDGLQSSLTAHVSAIFTERGSDRSAGRELGEEAISYQVSFFQVK
jgi:hypothetical protein